MNERDKDDFCDKFVRELREDNAAVFIGAGLSKEAGYVDWPGLLSNIADELGLNILKENDLVAVAQYHLNSNSANRNQLSQLLVDEFADLKQPTKNHEILARLPIRTYWTTNYDRLIEKALEGGGKRVDAKYTREQLATTRRGRDAIVYKMHGDIEHPDKAVLSKDDYENYYNTHAPFITALSGELIEKTFLFLGFSFSDPNLDFILSRIRTTFTNHQRQHFCIMRSRSRLPGESEQDFSYAQVKQALATQDLLRFNIRTLFVDDFSHITDILQTIENRFRRQTIFISGSAADFGDWGREATEDFVSTLARCLIEKNLRISSGFGLGIGSAVVTGAVQQIYSTRKRSIEEQLILRPFPIGIADETEKQATFIRYREELIGQAGIAIFVMGNKKVEGSIINADGVRHEFELAKRSGVHVIPIGASGSMAAELWNDVVSDLSSFYSMSLETIRPIFEELGRPTAKPATLIKPILNIIDYLSKG